jgi:uncharacterized membrane protein YhhN
VTLVFSIATFAALSVVLAGEVMGSRLLLVVFKPLASLCFLLAALSAGALASPYGQAIFGALVLSAAGDVFLLSKRREWFLAGLASFLLSHLVYAYAFVLLGVDGRFVGIGLGVLAVTSVGVGRWILGHAPGPMRRPVGAYIAVITGMVALAWGAYGAGATALVPVAALLFYASDLAVARQRFVRESFVNRLWGLPMYYAAQIAFVWTLRA